MAIPPLSSEIRALAEFARFVDRDSETRQAVKVAESLEDVASIAKSKGYPAVTARVLLKASHQLMTTRWIWQQYGREWKEHIFALSLVMLREECPG